MSNTTEHIYLDYNATAPLRPEVKKYIENTLSDFGNPSSTHAYGRMAREKVDIARDDLAIALGALPEQVIFTSGGTEANMLAILGGNYDTHLVSSVCHPSIMKAKEDSLWIPVDDHGLIEIDYLESMLEKASGKTLVSIALVNNETGVIQDISTIIDILKKYNALLHIDAVQAFGKIPLNFSTLAVDFMSISAHKVGGCHGAGALIVKDKSIIRPLQRGGGQEFGYRSGTENVMAIGALGQLAKNIETLIAEQVNLAKLRDDMECQIKEITQGCQGNDQKTLFIGQDVTRVANTSNLTMPGVDAYQQLMHFDLNNIAVSPGSACSSGKVAVSHILQALGIKEKIARTAIRVSLGWNTRKNEIEKFILCWKQLYDAQHNKKKVA